jgi:hypothetical protein
MSLVQVKTWNMRPACTYLMASSQASACDVRMLDLQNHVVCVFMCRLMHPCMHDGPCPVGQLLCMHEDVHTPLHSYVHAGVRANSLQLA